MTTRTFAALAAVLIAVVLGESVALATNVAITDFDGSWSGTVTYNPGDIVTFQGATYICTTQNTKFGPATHPNYWKVLAPAGGTGATGPAGPAGPTGPAGPQGPPGSGGIGATLAVVDANGQVVGLPFYPNGPNSAVMLLNLAGQAVGLPLQIVDGVGYTVTIVDSNVTNTGTFLFYHNAADCSDTRLLKADPTFSPTTGLVYGSTIYFPDKSNQQAVAGSVQYQEYVLPGMDPTQTGPCAGINPISGLFFAARSVPNPLVNFSPPFRMQVR